MLKYIFERETIMELSGTYACSLHVLNDKIYNKYLEYAYSKIPDYILKYSKIMRVNVEKVLNNLIYNESKEEYEKVLSTFLGVYANYIAFCYLNKYYKNICLECEIDTDIGKTTVDLIGCKNNKTNLFEVKATKQLMTNDKYYEKSPYDYLCKDVYEKQYLNTGISLMKQMEKLTYHSKKTNDIINIVIFKDCHICPDISKYIIDNGINIIRLPFKIEDIINHLNEVMSDICIYGKNLYYEKNYMPTRRIR